MRAVLQRSRCLRASVQAQRVEGSVGGLADPAREVEAVAERLRHRLVLHDVVGGPAARLRAHRAAEARQGRGHRGEARAAAAVAHLKQFAQVRREDVALDERVAEEGDAHGAFAVEQRLAEGREAAHARGVEILDRDQCGVETRRVGAAAQRGAVDVGPRRGDDGERSLQRVGRDRGRVACLAGVPLEGDLHRLRQRVGGDSLGDLREVDAELLLVEQCRLGGFGGLRFGLLEDHQVGEDVGAPQLDAADRLRRNEAHGGEYDEERRGCEAARAGAVLFGRAVFHRPNRGVRGSGRCSRAPKRRRSKRPRGRCGRPNRGPAWPARAVRPASCG